MADYPRRQPSRESVFGVSRTVGYWPTTDEGTDSKSDFSNWRETTQLRHSCQPFLQSACLTSS
jgi:hypothetical protein